MGLSREEHFEVVATDLRRVLYGITYYFDSITKPKPCDETMREIKALVTEALKKAES
jgi:hypothetical protein